MTTHHCCGCVVKRSWPGGLKEKPANDEGLNMRMCPLSDHANHTPAVVGVWFYVRPSPQPPETPAKQTPPPQNNLHTTPNCNLPKLHQKTTRATGTMHPPKGCIGFQGCLSAPTNHIKPQTENPNPPDKTWEQGCTMQDTRNPRWNHTPAWVSSLHKDPPDEDMNEPTVHAATQAPSACRPPETMIDKIAYHTPASAGCVVPSLHENRPDEDMDEPPPPKPHCPPPEMTIDEIAYHTPAKVVYCDAKRAWGKTWDHTATHTLILNFGQHIRGQNKYGATHPHQQTRSKAKHGTAPPPIPPTLDFPQQQNTKQIQHHTPALAGYHTIDTAHNIPPLKTG
ncbi:hypothetical protein BS47DRAFT_1360462 [Hydnum rufescens UP504]|uniref:Uncharacterized protein n=1 Tax=Hydnum rufescens UP504 TaxID=1448309 RepID=A0A9P6B266_9AGAM|nr:hypothetical protein BS47DRAFT_1360462 [Hydnum rufescens UP504]